MEEITVELLKKIGFKKIPSAYYAATCDVIGFGYEFKVGRYDCVSVWTSNNKVFFKTNSYSDNKIIENMDDLKYFMKEETDKIILRRFEQMSS